ncbi:MAG: RES family NAD+ phosphorylase [Mucilaginibacter sp.]|uniref:RES family NAD+ phosphorylase n=1 Tax=Mucilaginibacter sp. L3T2-6 TaxID=3062491 RepID=UPI0026745C7C|nr:RES family NAD+ phosphorylase [Mucilaginibacter sp. L3T2-6]MDO3641650.1 RES family NAD+ phosphorylase [Mucilaginibacter sp. L3T2-6]MDV6214144.1 RES family NAD+ phosphorylase [Mucilaginibacter sp. L3T2-6]
MILYRIARCQYVNDLSGTGARLYGGRWSSIGKPVVYLASSSSLAVLEVLVHLQPLLIPDGYCRMEMKVPDDKILSVKTDELPDNWRDISPPQTLTRFGDRFIKEGKYLLLKVPSSIVPSEYNYLLNPAHPEMNKVKLLTREPFDFDSRLV